MLSVFRKQSEPIVVGNSSSPEQISSVDASNVTPLPGISGAGLEVIEHYEKVPHHQSVLTAGDSRSVFIIPSALENAIVALETGPKRAVILFDPDAPREQLSEILRLLRTRLNVESYDPGTPEHACRTSVIKQVLDDYRSRTKDEGEQFSDSKAKDLWERIVDLAVRARATDIHLRLMRSRAEVQIRVDGELEPLPDGHGGVYHAQHIELAVAWAYNNTSQSASNSASLYHKDKNLYTMIKPRVIDGKEISLRYQSLVGAYGPKVVARVLQTDFDAPTWTYGQLGYYKSHIRLWKETARTPAGMIIISGVTGSGKTTVLKTFIETHPDNGRAAFLSLENPIEYPLRGVHQVPLQIDLLDPQAARKRYAEVFQSTLRQDPDAVIVGEIRDPASGMAAQHVAQSGHMAAGTLHAHLISGIIPRLTDDEIGMSRSVLTNPNMLSLLAYQALVPMLCQHCRIQGSHKSELEFARHISRQSDDDNRPAGDPFSDAIEDIEYVLSNLERRFNLPRDIFYFRRKDGCPQCRGRGTKGLTVVAEMMIPDSKWLSHIRKGEDSEALLHYRSFSDRDITSENMDGKTVFEHTLHKALIGHVDPREGSRFDSFSRFHFLENK
jgi:type II secretory ATPase GspE/PulE/Tfp pilus assembly ATPase PilB-like protein